MTDVVITGMGVIAPSGHDVDAMWASVRDGVSAVRRLEGPGFDDLSVRVGAPVRGFDPTGLVAHSLHRRLSPVQLWAIAAADQAMAGAGVTASGATRAPEAAPQTGTAEPAAAPSAVLPWPRERVEVIAATGSGPVDAQQSATGILASHGPRKVPSSLSIFGASDAAAALISERHDLRGASTAVSATCASGAVGIGEGMRRIRHGYTDAVLVVGMEDCLNPVNLASNANMRALAYGYEDEPARACRPFDRDRRGFVMGQGAAAVLLESADAARERGAHALAVVSGYGASSDAHHPTAPHPDGRGAARAVRDALADAGEPTIDHINAHGTGTPAGDAAELKALEHALGERAHTIPLSATKASTGHLLGASGVLEAIIAAQTMRQGTLPPTLNLDDPEFDDWAIVTAATEASIRHVLSTSFGFGGHNAALILSRPDL